MEKVYLFIDHQTTRGTAKPYRLRVITGTKKARQEVKALYYKTNVEALKMKKHLRDVISALNKLQEVR